MNKFSNHFFAIFVLFVVVSCAPLKHGNFNKQKYLKGQLKSTYTESEATIQETHSLSDSENSDGGPYGVSSTADTGLTPELDGPLNSEEKSDMTDTGQGEDEPVSEPHFSDPTEKEKQRFEKPDSKFLKRIPLAKPDSGASISWIIILVFLALIALPFAFLIGFWAFVISGALLLIALIILLAADPFVSGDGIIDTLISSIVMVIILISLLVLIGIALVVALIWFIVWGIIQLIN